MEDFNIWYEENKARLWRRVKEGGDASMISYEYKVLETIERLEDYPCTMSCYATKEELQGAKQMKETFLRILKEGLL